jgi:hypothetical protein
MLEMLKSKDEVITVSVQMTKRQIASLYYTQIRSTALVTPEQPRLHEAVDKEAIATVKARKLLWIASRRTVTLGRKYFDDPSWHALLDLYVQESEGKQTSISSACVGTLAAPTTALRHIENLTRDGLLVRVPDPQDKRRVWIALSRETRDRLTDLLGRSD